MKHMKPLFQKYVFMGLWDQGSWSKKFESHKLLAFLSKARLTFLLGYFFIVYTASCDTEFSIPASACQMLIASPFIVTKEISLHRHLQIPFWSITDQTLEPIMLKKEEAATYCWSKTTPAAWQSSSAEPGLKVVWLITGEGWGDYMFCKLYHWPLSKARCGPAIWAHQSLISDEAPISCPALSGLSPRHVYQLSSSVRQSSN